MSLNQLILAHARELLPSVIIRYGTEEFMTRDHAEEIVNEAILLADVFFSMSHELKGVSYDALKKNLNNREPN